MRAWVRASFLLLAASASAQSLPCPEDALQRANKSYEAGRFDEVAILVSPCLEAPLPRARIIEFRALLAKAALQSDEVDTARDEVSAILRLDSTFEGGQPPRFAALVAEVKREQQTTQVASVSKTNESLREAPATVVVVTADEIQRRGYLDLEQLLHDLPGFDISRLNGKIYSNIYQRGYRSAANDRLLLLVDGVEQNELSSNTLYLSRQYPLTNIDRVEVIYGPASTMYGANAYTGVISILTRDPESVAGGDKTFGVAGQVTSGGYGSRMGDVTMAGRDGSGTLAWSVAANFQQSRERDLSHFSDWDYTYRNVDYASSLVLTGAPATNFRANCAQTSPYSQYLQCDNPAKIALSPAGESLVRGLDGNLIRDSGLGFDDRATNWSLYGKVRLSNLTVGLQTWRSREGTASQVRAIEFTGRTSWTPSETALYLKYSLPLDKMKINLFTRYEQTSIERSGSKFEYLHTYAKNYLTLLSLVPPCRPASDPKPQGCPPGPALPWVETVTFGSLSSQLRSEINATFDSWEKVKVVGGLELAKSSIQSQLEQKASGPGQLFHAVTDKPEQIEHTDVALYAQGAWKPRPSLKLVLAGRVTHNQINNKPGAAGFGTLFTPRAAVIYSPAGKRFVLKAIYSEAFKDPTDAEKFGVLTSVNNFPSAGLRPETVRNGEISAGWEASEHSSFEASAYQARYSDVVGFIPVVGCSATVPGCQRYANRDELRIRGFQGTARYGRGGTEVWGNYTYADPRLMNPNADLHLDHLAIADIASNRLNAGLDLRLHDRWNGGLRAHYVGARKSGQGTTEPRNPFTRMDPYTTVDATLSDSRLIPGGMLQLAVYNLFNKQYYDPSTDPLGGVARVPQAGRTVYLRLIVAMPSRSRSSHPTPN